MRKIPLYRTLLSNFMFIFLFQLFVNLVSLFNFRKAHGWSPMVELCRWSGQITLGVWVKKGYSFSLFHFCHELLSVVKAESFTILIGATALLRSSFTNCANCVFFFTLVTLPLVATQLRSLYSTLLNHTVFQAQLKNSIALILMHVLSQILTNAHPLQ